MVLVAGQLDPGNIPPNSTNLLSIIFTHDWWQGRILVPIQDEHRCYGFCRVSNREC